MRLRRCGFPIRMNSWNFKGICRWDERLGTIVLHSGDHVARAAYVGIVSNLGGAGIFDDCKSHLQDRTSFSKKAVLYRQ